MIFPVALAIIAALYAAVGQAGGTGYIAAMGLAGFSPDVIKPTALALNILVAGIGTLRFAKAGHLTWRSCYPFAILGAPFSVLGGATHLPPSLYEPVVGCLLLVAGLQVVRSTPTRARGSISEPPFFPALLTGGGIGFISGMTGVGGGIFLAPLVLTMGWVEIRQAAAISAVFNLLNSAAALVGSWAMSARLPDELGLWLLAVGLGALFGSWLAVRHLPTRALRYILAAVLLSAGVRMIAI